MQWVYDKYHLLLLLLLITSWNHQAEIKLFRINQGSGWWSFKKLSKTVQISLILKEIHFQCIRMIFPGSCIFIVLLSTPIFSFLPNSKRNFRCLYIRLQLLSFKTRVKEFVSLTVKCACYWCTVFQNHHSSWVTSLHIEIIPPNTEIE